MLLCKSCLTDSVYSSTPNDADWKKKLKIPAKDNRQQTEVGITFAGRSDMLLNYLGCNCNQGPRV